MRAGRVLVPVAVLAIVGGASVAAAPPGTGTVAERIAEIVARVCVAPTTPTGVIAAGDRLASASHWSLDAKRSGEHYGVGQPRDQPPFFVDKVWTTDDPGMKATVSIRIVGPGYPDQRMTQCTVSVPGQFQDAFVEATRRAMGLGVGESQDADGLSLTTWLMPAKSAVPGGGTKFVTVATRHETGGWTTEAGAAEYKVADGAMLGDEN